MTAMHIPRQGPVSRARVARVPPVMEKICRAASGAQCQPAVPHLLLLLELGGKKKTHPAFPRPAAAPAPAEPACCEGSSPSAPQPLVAAGAVFPSSWRGMMFGDRNARAGSWGRTQTAGGPRGQARSVHPRGSKMRFSPADEPTWPGLWCSASPHSSVTHPRQGDTSSLLAGGS